MHRQKILGEINVNVNNSTSCIGELHGNTLETPSQGFGKTPRRLRAIKGQHKGQHTKASTKGTTKASTKGTTKASTKGTTKASTKASINALPFLRFYHSEVLRTKTIAVLTTLEDSPDPTKHRDALARLVVELNDAGMDYCFIKPLKLAKPGFIVEQSATLGMAGALQVIGSVVRNIIGRMDAPQLLSVSASIRQLIR